MKLYPIVYLFGIGLSLPSLYYMLSDGSKAAFIMFYIALGLLWFGVLVDGYEENR